MKSWRSMSKYSTLLENFIPNIFGYKTENDAKYSRILAESAVDSLSLKRKELTTNMNLKNLQVMIESADEMEESNTLSDEEIADSVNDQLADADQETKETILDAVNESNESFIDETVKKAKLVYDNATLNLDKISESINNIQENRDVNCLIVSIDELTSFTDSLFSVINDLVETRTNSSDCIIEFPIKQNITLNKTSLEKMVYDARDNIDNVVDSIERIELKLMSVSNRVSNDTQAANDVIDMKDQLGEFDGLNDNIKIAIKYIIEYINLNSESVCDAYTAFMEPDIKEINSIRESAISDFYEMNLLNESVSGDPMAVCCIYAATIFLAAMAIRKAKLRKLNYVMTYDELTDNLTRNLVDFDNYIKSVDPRLLKMIDYNFSMDKEGAKDIISSPLFNDGTKATKDTSMFRSPIATISIKKIKKLYGALSIDLLHTIVDRLSSGYETVCDDRNKIVVATYADLINDFGQHVLLTNNESSESSRDDYVFISTSDLMQEENINKLRIAFFIDMNIVSLKIRNSTNSDIIVNEGVITNSVSNVGRRFKNLFKYKSLRLKPVRTVTSTDISSDLDLIDNKLLIIANKYGMTYIPNRAMYNNEMDDGVTCVGCMKFSEKELAESASDSYGLSKLEVKARKITENVRLLSDSSTIHDIDVDFVVQGPYCWLDIFTMTSKNITVI